MVKVSASKEYTVYIEKGLLLSVGEKLRATKRLCRVVLISDNTVFALYGEKVKRNLTDSGYSVCEYVFPHGEESKSFENYEKILDFCVENSITRTALFIALGGGVVGDLTGFVASTYLRGVDFAQIPTTLLAMVDSSVGGKTAINLKSGKNLCGAFYQPIAVFADCETLSTLPQETFNEGCAEIIKYGMICDKDFLEFLQNNSIKDNIEYVIKRCVEIKSDIVNHDEFETTLDHQQLKISSNEIIYVERYDITKNIAYRFSYDKFDGKKLVERITAQRIQYDSLYNWTAHNCMQRKFVDLKEEVTTQPKMELELNMIPKDFIKVAQEYEQLTTGELVNYLEVQGQRGLSGLNAYELELQKRIANPFAAFILTIIGVSVASRKSRGGTGFHIFIGFLLSVTYILFSMVSSSLTIKGGMNPIVSVWLPNVLYLAIGIYLYKIAPK